MDGFDYETRHRTFNTPEEAVFLMVRKATGKRPITRRKITQGKTNEVYCVTAHDRQEYIVRIRRGGRSPLKSEAWVLGQFLLANLPVPEVLLTDHLELPGGALEFMVQTKLPGIPLRLADLPHETRGNAFRKAGEILNAFHTRVRIPGYYLCDGNGTWPFDTWNKFVDHAVSTLVPSSEALSHLGFDNSELQQIRRFLIAFGSRPLTEAPALCHGDFTRSHVLVDDDGAISGIIDFDSFEGNRTVHDFAIIRWDDESYFRAVLDGYTRTRPVHPGFLFDLHLHQMFLVLVRIGYKSRCPGHPELPVYVRRLRESLLGLQTERCSAP